MKPTTVAPSSSLGYTCYAGGGRLGDECQSVALDGGEKGQESVLDPGVSCRGGNALAAADFLLPGLEGVVFVAWGGADGMVYVGYYMVREGVCGEGGEGRRDSPAGSQRIGLRTVLALPLRKSDTLPISPVRRVVYGGGPKALLMAASDAFVAVFSLESLMYEMVDHLESAVGFLGNGLERDVRYRVCEGGVVFGAEVVVAVGWTGRWDGVLVSTVRDGGDKGVGAVAHLRMWAVRDDGMEMIWSTETAGVQRIVQAGVSAFSPCVTTSGREGFASVWWYESGDGGDGPDLKAGCQVRLEELKHPAVVKDVEWSAGVLRKGDGAAEQLQDASRPLEDHPAIMTVDEDGCVRIWVEMMVMISRARCDCYFAMNLVIPPGNVVGGRDSNETKAMWVKPVDHAFQRHSHHVNTHQRILWLIVSRGKTLSLYALRGLAPVVVSSALTSPGTGARPVSDSPNRDVANHRSQSRLHSTSAQPKKPQLLLWGEYAWEGLVGGVYTRLSARMLHGDDFPVVDCIETGMDDGGNFLLSSGVSLVTTLQEDVSTGLQPASGVQQGIHLKRAWSGFGRLRGYEILSTLVMRRFVALLDASGCLDVWRLGSTGTPPTVAESSKRDRDFMTYYGSLPLGNWLDKRSDLSEVSMVEVASTPAGYDSIVLVVASRRVMQIAVATNPERMDIGIVGDWHLRDAGAVLVMKDQQAGVSLSMICIRADTGRIICESYDVFAEQGDDLRGDEEGCRVRGQDLVPSSSAVLPVALEDAETIVQVQNAEQRHAIMIGTSTSRVLFVHMGQMRGLCSANSLTDGRQGASLPDDSSADAPKAPLSPVNVPADVVDTFSIDTFQSLEYDPSHGLLAAVHASNGRVVTIYKIVVAGKWCIMPCGEIRCQSTVTAAKWMAGEVLPCIAIADKAGLVAVFTLDNTKINSWAGVASFQGGRDWVATQLSYAHSYLVCTSGRYAGVVGTNVQEPNGRVQKLGKVLLNASGPLPLYHPKVIRALVLSGHLEAFFDVLTALKMWLDTIDSDAVDSLECCSRESSDDLASPSMEGAKSMPHMFPGVSMDNFITMSAADISKALEKIEALLHDQGSRRGRSVDRRGEGDGHHRGRVSPDALRHAEASDPVHVGAPPFETGMLDMSAFGMGMPADVSTSPPPMAPTAQAPSLETGMLDMSAFGMGLPADVSTSPPPMAPTAQAPSLETGMLDMSAFGMCMPQSPVPAPVTGPGDPLSPTFRRQPCITLESSKTFSLQQCQKYSSLLDELINRMKSTGPDSAVSGLLPNNTRYVPGLGEEDAARLDASIRTTRDVMAELQQDVDTSTVIFLLNLAWCAENDTSNGARAAHEDAEDVDLVARKPSFVNAAGVPMDYGLLDQDGEAQSRTSTGLSAVLGLGPLVSPEALLWMCLSPQDGSQAIHVVQKIQGEVPGSAKPPWKPPNAMNSSNVFLAVPQSKSERANTWESIRSTGVAFWQQDRDVLIALLEDCAKAKFRETRDPDTVALLYAAVGKISVLRGLYKTCNRSKEAEFFFRDFSLENNKVAANKNAFVLLGQHRYAMAATFFVLGGKLQDAVEVCLHQMADIQLAIVLYRTLAEDLDFGSMLQVTLQAYEQLSVASFLRHWVSGNLPGAIESLLTIRHPSEGIWLVQALMHVICVSSGGAPMGDGRMDADPISMLRLAAVFSADVLNRSGLSILAIESELIASIASTVSSKALPKTDAISAPKAASPPSASERKPCRSAREASYACALTMIESPIALIPDLFAEDDFNQRIVELIARIEEIQKHGIEVSTNAVLHRIERIYKSLSYCETATSPATPKSGTPGSLGGAFSGLGLGRSGSMDAQSRTSNQTSGFSSLRRTSLDDVHERQQLAKMISRSKLADSAAENAPQIVYPKGVEIFRVDADNILSVCSCPLLAPDVCGRLVAVSTAKNGILEFATHPDVAVGGHGQVMEVTTPGPFQETPRYDSPTHQSGMFSKLVSQIFDQTSWMTDPLENQSVMIDGDVGLAVGVHGKNPASPRSPDAARLADAKTTHSKILVAHPHRQLFLSVCRDTARIKLWQYDGPRPVRLFTPVPYDDLQRLASMNHDIFSMSSNFSQSQSLASKMSHWGKAVDMCFSENGERFASMGEGGVVAVWSLNSSFTKDAGTDVDGASCSEWWHTCLKNQGRSVAFVGGRSAVVAAAGQCDAGNISLWNTSLPDRESCIGRFRHHKAPVNKVKTLPGGWLLASADDAGILSLSDVRMLGSDRDAVLWSTRACKGVVRAMDTIAYESSPAVRQHSFKRHHFIPGNDAAIVTGGDDGIVRLWDVNSGTLLQQSEPIYAPTPKSNRLLSLASNGDAKYTVTGLAVCEEGVLSSGSDGVVRLYVRT